VGELAALIGQTITEKFAVILFIRQPGDAKGDKAGLLIEELKPAIKTALIGWRPQAEAKTPVWYQSGRLVSIEAGAVYYQMEFLVQQRYRVFA
ncbi:MAG: hypothetical protein ACK559_22890, partial [bacterium]